MGDRVVAAQAPGSADVSPERRVTLALENLLIEVQKSIRAVSFYPSSHPILNTIHQTSFDLIRKAAHYFSELEIEIGRQNISYKGAALGERNESIQALGQHLFRRRVKRFILQEGISFEEYQQFLRAAALDPEEVYLRGGLDTILLEGHVRHIWMNQVDFDRLRRIESGEEEKPEERGTPPPPDAALFLDTATLDTKPEDETLSPEEQSLAKVLPVLDQTADPNKYYEGVLLLASLAERFMAEHQWKPLFSIVSRLEQHSSDPRRSVEFKKYSYRALRKITTPEVLRALLTELCAENKEADEIESLLGILAILGLPAAEAILSRLGYAKDAYVRNLMEQALYRIGPAGAPRVQQLLSSDNPDWVCLALRVLGRYRLPESVEALGTPANSKEPAVRLERARALLKIRTAAALDQLYDLLTERDEAVRALILKAFGHSREVRALPVLVNMAKSQKEFGLESQTRALLFQALGHIGGPEVCEVLIGILQERRLWRPRHDEDTLAVAIEALGEAATATGAGALLGLDFKSERLQRLKADALARIERRAAVEKSA